MPVFKKKYTYIKFPIKGRENAPEAIMRTYLREFCPNKNVTFKHFVSISLNACRDFFEGSLSEHGIGSLAHAFFVTPATKGFITKDAALFTLLSDLTDISWAKESSKDYETYKVELKKRYENLARNYS